VTEWDKEKEEAVINAAKKGGKELLTGLSKAGLHFTKRMAEGAFNAQMATQQHEETGDKLKAAGGELGRAFIKGAIEGASETLSGVILGVNAFSQEMSKTQETDNQTIDKKDKDDGDTTDITEY
jgi:hypothetical protein